MQNINSHFHIPTGGEFSLHYHGFMIVVRREPNEDMGDGDYLTWEVLDCGSMMDRSPRVCYCGQSKETLEEIVEQCQQWIAKEEKRRERKERKLERERRKIVQRKVGELIRERVKAYKDYGDSLCMIIIAELEDLAYEIEQWKGESK